MSELRHLDVERTRERAPLLLDTAGNARQREGDGQRAVDDADLQGRVRRSTRRLPPSRPHSWASTMPRRGSAASAASSCRHAEGQWLIALGATPVDVKQGPEGTEKSIRFALANPEGNEICVLRAETVARSADP